MTVHVCVCTADVVVEDEVGRVLDQVCKVKKLCEGLNSLLQRPDTATTAGMLGDMSLTSCACIIHRGCRAGGTGCVSVLLSGAVS